MNKFFTIYLATILSLLFSACDKTNEDILPDENDTRTPRTVLVYMVANNSLNGFDERDLAEMEMAVAAGDLGNSRLIIYHHKRNEDPVLMELTPDGRKILKTYDTTEYSVSSARMTEVIADMKSAAPALHYGLVLWSHGSGWLQNGIDDTVNPQSAGDSPEEFQSYAFGSDRNKWMNITTLAQTLEGKGFDYIYFDCCFMMGVEVVYELRNAAQTIVGSVIEIPADGMPYDLNLQYLMPGNADLVGAAQSTFNYYNQMSGISRTCTMSVVNTAGLEQLASATARIYACQNPVPDGFRPQEYMMSNLYESGRCYLFDFQQYVEAQCTDPVLLEQFKSALDNVVVYRESTPYIWTSIAIEHHCGVSTFILKDASDSQFRNYNQLQWWTDVASQLF